MHFCKSKKHVWRHKIDAEKCCNGYRRIFVIGNNVPEDATNIKIDKQTGLKSGRIWIKVEKEEEFGAITPII